jgi:hypothetical protein
MTARTHAQSKIDHQRTPKHQSEIFLGSVAVLHWWRKPRFVRVSAILVTESPLANRRFGERVFFHRGPMGRRMSKEGIATLQYASMGLLCDPRKQEEILNDLWFVWVKLALELELENIVRRRFPGHSEGAYGRLERWIDELGFIGSDVRFLAQRRRSVIISWFAAGAFTNWWKIPRKSRPREC